MKPRNADAQGQRRPVKVLYASRNDGTDTRISKECNSLLAVGYQVVFVGWDRNPGVVKSNPMPAVDKEVMIGEGGGAMGTLRQYWRFYRFLVASLFRHRPQIVHAVNEDLGFLVAPYKWLLHFGLIVDVFDSIALKFGRARVPVRQVARWVSVLVWRASDALLLTDADRAALLTAYRHKLYIVPNYPVDTGPPLQLGRHSAPEGVIRLYVAGTLYRERGLRQLMAVLDLDPALCVVSAGWLYDDQARDFVAHDRVDFKGLVTPHESLQLAATCDAIYCYYEPSNPNNIMASPNKIYDAMCVGRPVLINSEVKVAQWVVQERLGYSAPYAGTGALAALIQRLRAGRSEQAAEARRLRARFLTGYSWATAQAELLQCYRALTDQEH